MSRYLEPYREVMIFNVAGKPTDDYEMEKIRGSHCLNCGDVFNETKALTYVRLIDSGELIWWHRSGTCPVSSHGGPLSPHRRRERLQTNANAPIMMP